MTSMTGHGRGEARSGAWTVVAECFSVNRKTAEVVCHCDRASAWLEPVVREAVLARIARGRVQVNLSVVFNGTAAASLIDRARAAAFVTAARSLQKSLALPGEVTLSDVLAAPGVLRLPDPEGSPVEKAARAALAAALDGLVATREREGRALARAIAKSLAALARCARAIEPFARTVAATHRESLLRRITKSGLPIDASDPRLLTEIALFAERADISEELARIASHLAQFREKTGGTAPAGRTLEFLAQELGREFNTIGSKSSDTRIARLVIEAKAEIDKLREQLANIE